MFKAFWIWFTASRINLSRGITILPFGAVYSANELANLKIDWDNVSRNEVLDKNNNVTCSGYDRTLVLVNYNEKGNRLNFCNSNGMRCVYYYDSKGRSIGYKQSFVEPYELPYNT